MKKFLLPALLAGSMFLASCGTFGSSETPSDRLATAKAYVVAAEQTLETSCHATPHLKFCDNPVDMKKITDAESDLDSLFATAQDLIDSNGDQTKLDAVLVEAVADATNLVALVNELKNEK